MAGMSNHGEKSCVVLGGGDHAKVLIDLLYLQDGINPYVVLDSISRLWGSKILGVPVEGDDSLLPALKERGVRHFVVGLGSIKDNGPRTSVYCRALDVGLEPWTAIHPTAVISPFASFGSGCQIMAGAVINPDCQLAENVIINTSAVVEHDCRVGAHTHVAPGAILGGRVQVGSGALIGSGAVLRQGVKVGDRAVVAAGAIVVSEVPAATLVAGVPARERNVEKTALLEKKAD